jgi:hypothetical protein
MKLWNLELHMSRSVWMCNILLSEVLQSWYKHAVSLLLEWWIILHLHVRNLKSRTWGLWSGSSLTSHLLYQLWHNFFLYRHCVQWFTFFEPVTWLPNYVCVLNSAPCLFVGNMNVAAFYASFCNSKWWGYRCGIIVLTTICTEHITINFIIIWLCLPVVGWASVFGIVTCYRLDSSGIKSWWGQDFLHSAGQALGPTQPPVQWAPCLFPGRKVAGMWCWHPHPSSAQVKERVEL